jgi:hypothetical protein
MHPSGLRLGLMDTKCAGDHAPTHTFLNICGQLSRVLPLLTHEHTDQQSNASRCLTTSPRTTASFARAVSGTR